jgi:hypothetical protein
VSQSLGDWVNMLGGNARRAVTDPESATPLDRTLMAAALVGVAIVIVWPHGKPPPAVVGWAVATGKAIWVRKDQWVPPTN